MIELIDATKRFGGKTAVDKVSFALPPGRVTALIGPNGAGKTTTLRLILGLDKPSGGRVLVDGRPYYRLRTPLTAVGALLDGSAAHPGRRACDHLRWLAAGNGIPARRVDEVLEITGLSAVARERVRGFSLGMKQRLGIAAALLGDPPALLLDEPLNGLDPAGIRWARTLIRDRAAGGGTVLVSSHLMTEMSQIAEHGLVIARGRILADAPLAELQSGHASLEDAFFGLTEGHAEFQAGR
ncbi:ATP-binding cassette domain-containing protein [Actinocrinis puniceicyclus]|uniref:ATP-binding cassette domain-containing protein n=1 Tax=Actinocrinis puniceicyclus TaxID=977794 RepID=A0A8J7WS64_9ACTN|nr:ATP-binding cassette domain-containing protein [Actinocrinis puniceicyclus]MBS2965189.1 ATP-binding cassette domain-containing protein [Actinocrinis puniceicyclus]